MRSFLFVSLVAASLLAISACTPPSPKQPGEGAKKTETAKKPPAPQKPKPTNPWLESLVAKAEVEVKVGDTVTKCTYQAGSKRHVCDGLNNWMYVGGQALKVGGNDAYCVWNHPITGGTVTTKLPGVAKEKLTFRHAFPGRAAEQKQLDPVQAELKVDGKSVAKLTRERSPGFAAATIEPAAEGAGDLEIVITTTKDGAAHYCWQLDKADAKAAAVAPVPTPGAPPAAATGTTGLTTTKISPDAKKLAVSKATKAAAVKKAIAKGKLQRTKRLQVEGAAKPTGEE